MWVVLGTALLFTFSALVFHAVLLRLDLPRWIWEATEYSWFGVTGLALLGASLQVMKTSVREARIDAGHDAANLQIVLLESTRSRAKLYHQWATHPPVDGPVTAHEAKEAATWFDGAVVCLLSNSPYTIEAFLREPLTGSAAAPAALREQQRELLDYMDKLRGLLERILDLEQESETTWFEHALIRTYPWLLAIVLALRITKVSAWVRLARQTAPPPTQ